jgi:hypothetical protein
MTKIKQVICGEGGWRAEVYTDDDNGSGYGENPMIGYWFGTKEECEMVNPNDVKLYPANYPESPDPFDLACERRWD